MTSLKERIGSKCKNGPNGKAEEFVKEIMNIINMRLGRHGLQSVSYLI